MTEKLRMLKRILSAEALANSIGIATLFAMYAGTALVIAWLGDTTIDRGLLFVSLYALAQLRWHQDYD